MPETDNNCRRNAAYKRAWDGLGGAEFAGIALAFGIMGQSLQRAQATPANAMPVAPGTDAVVWLIHDVTHRACEL